MWKPRPKDIKQYPHLDAPLSTAELIRVANDTSAVAKHAFLPLISFEKVWQPYRSVSPRPVPKPRVLRYAGRLDAAIYARYRALLSDRYEEYLLRHGLAPHVIGYRKITDETGRGGKTNIHFARDAFDFIRRTEVSTGLVADISSFFECMDHAQLQERWARVLGTPRLHDDHFAIFRQATRYRVIKQDELYVALGFAEKKAGKMVYKVRRREMPKQLADMPTFRSLFDASNPNKISVEKHSNSFGIPQGLPISDVLANLYMIDFDAAVSAWCKLRGGFYQRYSDDIICILPGVDASCADILMMLRRELGNNGSELRIKDTKVLGGVYTSDIEGERVFSCHVGRARNGVEYLGFRYDGARVYLRDKTVANLNRQFKRRARGMAAGYVRRYRDKGRTWLLQNFNIEAAVSAFLQSEKFEEAVTAKDWTFWTYARKAEAVLAGLNPRVFQQLSGFRRRAAPFLEETLSVAVSKS